jgi:hypothetical protein
MAEQNSNRLREDKIAPIEETKQELFANTTRKDEVLFTYRFKCVDRRHTLSRKSYK